MKRRSAVWLHLGYWAVYLLLLAAVFTLARLQSRGGASVWSVLFASPVGVATTVPSLAAFYGAYLRLFPRYLAPRRRFALAAWALLWAAACAALGVAAVALLFGPVQVAARPVELAGLLFLLAAVALLHIAAALVIRGFLSWYEATRANDELGMALLRSKLDPHFLFNTLNNIDVLIAKDPATASAYLNKLSDILRIVVYDSQAERIPLAAELAHLERYIALERLRSANPGYLACEVSGPLDGLEIAPMVFLPFVENACKHVENRKTDQAIAIRVTVADRRVTFECRNTYRREAGRPPARGGVGNALIERRLRLLYPGRHRLTVTDREPTYDVHLTIDLDAP